MSASPRVLITGGASGLGRALAQAWLQQGSRVLIGDINQARADDTLAALSELPGELAYLPLDVRREQDFNHAHQWLEEHWGGLDILVNNAGVAAAARVDRGSLEDWDWIFDINIKSIARSSRIFVPMMKRQQSGHIVNIASLAGLMNLPVMASYNTTKAGVIALSETLRNELQPFGIHTTVVCPSFFRTNLHESLRSPEPGMTEIVDKLLSSDELTADDVAQSILRAVSKQQFMLIPHRSGRIAWRIKRLAPWLFLRTMKKSGLRLQNKLDRNGNQ